MMKIAVITKYFPISYEPWAGNSAYQTLRILAKRHELKVFYPEAVYPKALAAVGGMKKKFDPSYRPAGVDTQYIPYPALPVLSRPWNGLQAGRCVAPHVRKFNPDILLSYVIYPDGLAAVRVGRRLNVPVVVTSIGSDLNRITDPLCGILTRKVLRQADLVCTVSGDLLRTARHMGAPPHRSKAIINGCDTSIFYPSDKAAARTALGVDPGGSVVVYVGRLDVRKGLHELIQAAGRLRAKRAGLRCFLVGDGPDRPTLLKAIEMENARDWITLVPPCSTQQVALWMSAADVVTLPSYAEGCPNVVLEALAAGRPVVASDVGGIPEIMDASVGRLVPPRDVSALTAALDEVLSQSWDPSAIAERHTRSWSDVADEKEQMLKQLIATFRERFPKGHR